MHCLQRTNFSDDLVEKASSKIFVSTSKSNNLPVPRCSYGSAIALLLPRHQSRPHSGIAFSFSMWQIVTIFIFYLGRRTFLVSYFKNHVEFVSKTLDCWVQSKVFFPNLAHILGYLPMLWANTENFMLF